MVSCHNGLCRTKRGVELNQKCDHPRLREPTAIPPRAPGAPPRSGFVLTHVFGSPLRLAATRVSVRPGRPRTSQPSGGRCWLSRCAPRIRPAPCCAESQDHHAAHSARACPTDASASRRRSVHWRLVFGIHSRSRSERLAMIAASTLRSVTRARNHVEYRPRDDFPEVCPNVKLIGRGRAWHADRAKPGILTAPNLHTHPLGA